MRSASRKLGNDQDGDPRTQRYPFRMLPGFERKVTDVG